MGSDAILDRKVRPTLGPPAQTGGSETENERQCLIDSQQLAGFEPPRRWTEALRIDHCGLLDQDAGVRSVDVDHGTDCRGAGARRGWSDDGCAQVQKLVGLDDHRVTRSALLSAAGGASCREPEYLAPDHRLTRTTRCEFGHLLPNYPHLLAVGIVCGEPKRFLTQRCSRASTRGSFT